MLRSVDAVESVLGKPALFWDFEKMKVLPSEFTFTRTGSSMAWDDSGVLAHAPHNLLTYSEDLSNAAWWNNYTTITSNYATSHIGTATADAMFETAINSGTWSCEVSCARAVGTVYSYSAYVKPNGREYVCLSHGASRLYGVFLLTGAGSVVRSMSNGTDFSGHSATIELLSSGFYRVTVTGTALTSSGGLYVRVGIHDGNLTSPSAAPYDGDITKGIIIGGVQANYGSTALTYVPTTTAAVYLARLARAIPSGRRGLVMQGARTNLLVQSVLPGGGDPPTGWTRFAGGGTVAAATSIYGTDSAAYTFTSAAARPFIYQSVSLAANTTYTVSCEVEATTGATVQDAITIASAPVGLAVTGYTINGVAVSAGATLTTGKLAVTFGGTYSAGAALVWMGCGVVTGNVTATVTLSRPQLEAATFPSLYIPTTTGTAYRSADLCTHTLSAALAAALSTQGTMVVEASFLGGDSSLGSSARAMASIDDGTGSERVLIFNPSGVVGVVVTDGGFGQGTLSVAGATAANTATRFAATWKANDIQFSKGGTAATRDPTATMPTVTKVGVGLQSDGSFPMFGVVHKIWIYTHHCATDAELAQVTRPDSPIVSQQFDKLLPGLTTTPAGWTFTRASAATYRDQAGTIRLSPHNMLTYSEDLTGANWSLHSSATRTASYALSPIGDMTASRLQIAISAVSGIQIPYVTAAGGGVTYTYSVWLRSNTSSNQVVRIKNTHAGIIDNWLDVTVTPEWQRFSFTVTNGATAGSGQYSGIFNDAVGGTTKDILVWGSQLNLGSSALDYVKTTTAAVYDVMRIEYDTNGRKFFLSEGARTNLLTYSEDFRNTADAGATRPWVYTNCSITADATAAPDGTTTADKLIRTSGAGIRGVRQAYVATSGQTGTFSFYAKAAEFAFVGIVLYNTQGRATVNLSTLATATYGPSTTVTATSVGNGWVRCSITRTWDASGDVSPCITVQNSADDPALCPSQGDGTSGIYLWGAQLEAASFPSSYIPTAATAVTRAADLLTYTLTADDARTLSSQGSMQVEYCMPLPSTAYAAGGRYLAAVDDGTLNEAVAFYQNISASGIVVRDNNSGLADSTVTQTLSAYQQDNLAGAWALNNVRACRNGSLSVVDTSATMPTVSRIQVGGAFGANQIFGGVYSFNIWGYRKQDAELQTATAVNKSTLIFDATKPLPTGATMTRASLATCVGSDGLIQQVANDVLREDYDPVTKKYLGWLIEGQRTNRLVYSEDLTQANWTKTRVQPFGSGSVSNATIAPDGTLTADKLVEDTTASNDHYAQQNYTKAASALAYSFSQYIKAAERSSVYFVFYGSSFSNRVDAVFNAATGTISVAAAAYGSFTSASARMEDYGNGWYRCIVSFVTDTHTAVSCRASLHNGSSSAYTGDGTSGIYLWGAQLEEASFPSSYIPTTAATVTRLADSVGLTGAPATSVINTAEGTMFVEFDYTGGDSGKLPNERVVFSLDDGTINNRHHIYNILGYIGVVTQLGGATQTAPYFSDTLSTRKSTKVAYAYRASDFQLSYNGKSSAVSSSGSAPTVNQFWVGSLASVNGPGFCHIRKALYAPYRMTAEEMNALTASTEISYWNFGNRQLPTGLTFTRAGSATYKTKLGMVAYAAADELRYEYGTAAGRYGALLESAGTNLLAYSQDFGNAYWLAITAKEVAASPFLAPDGTLTAWTLSDSNTSNFNGTAKSVTIPNDGASYCMSIFIRKTEGGTSPTFAINFNLVGGTTVARNSRMNTDTGIVFAGGGSTYVEDYGSWWRLCISTTNNSSGNTTASINIYPAAREHNGVTDIVAATGSATIWGAQLEALPHATSYIPTTAAAATRLADALYSSSGASAPFINKYEGTIMARYSLRDVDSSVRPNSRVVASLNDGSAVNSHQLYHTGVYPGSYTSTASVGQGNPAISTILLADVPMFSALSYRDSYLRFVANGRTAPLDTVATMPAIDRIHFSEVPGWTTVSLSGLLYEAIYSPVLLPDSVVTTLTLT